METGRQFWRAYRHSVRVRGFLSSSQSYIYAESNLFSAVARLQAIWLLRLATRLAWLSPVRAYQFSADMAAR